MRRLEVKRRGRNSTLRLVAATPLTHNNTGPPPGSPPRGPPPPRRAAAARKVPGAPDLPKFGQLQVHVVRGSSLKAGQSMYGRADPYAKLTLGNQVFATNPHANGGKDPVWNADHTHEISTEKRTVLGSLRQGAGGQRQVHGPR